jgi:hypothetical protein
MILTGVSKSMLEKACRDQSLLKGRDWPPIGAVEEVAKAMHEHSCAEWAEWSDEQEMWDRLPQGSKQIGLDCVTWLIGRLAQADFVILSKR